MICCGRACMHRRPSFYGYISAGSEIQTSREPQIYFVFDLWAGPTRRKSGGLIITDFAGFFFFFFFGFKPERRMKCLGFVCLLVSPPYLQTLQQPHTGCVTSFWTLCWFTITLGVVTCYVFTGHLNLPNFAQSSWLQLCSSHLAPAGLVVESKAQV